MLKRICTTVCHLAEKMSGRGRLEGRIAWNSVKRRKSMGNACQRDDGPSRYTSRITRDIVGSWVCIGNFTDTLTSSRATNTVVNEERIVIRRGRSINYAEREWVTRRGKLGDNWLVRYAWIKVKNRFTLIPRGDFNAGRNFISSSS